MQTLKQRVAELEERNGALVAELTRATELITALEAERAASRRKVADLQRECAQLRKRLTVYRREAPPALRPTAPPFLARCEGPLKTHAHLHMEFDA